MEGCVGSGGVAGGGADANSFEEGGGDGGVGGGGGGYFDLGGATWEDGRILRNPHQGPPSLVATPSDNPAALSNVASEFMLL
jgi:hypothetical protein